MARKKAPVVGVAPTAEELARQEANAAAELRREKEKRKRQQNAEKQARHRKRMRAEGYREVKEWVKPPPPGKVPAFGFAASPLINESTVGVCERDPAMNEAVNAAMSGFLRSLRGDNFKVELPPGAYSVYKDIEALLAPLGYKAPY
jgi:hypothetical protein